MGGTSKTNQTTSQTQHTDPYAGAKTGIDSLLGQLGGVNPNLTGTETSALDALSANAQGGNPYAGKIGDVATSLLGGGPDRSGIVSDAYSKYQNDLTPTARGDFVNPASNPQLQGYLSTIQDDISKRVNGMFAGAGRDLSGANLQALGRGVAAGTAPVLYDAYNQGRNQQLGAIDKLYGAGGQTGGLLSGLDQIKLGNQTAGIDASKQALLSKDSPFMAQLGVEAQRRGIPMQNIISLLDPLLKTGQAFGTTSGTGTSSGTQQMSGAQQFALISQGLASLFGSNQKAGQAVSMGGG